MVLAFSQFGSCDINLYRQYLFTSYVGSIGGSSVASESRVPSGDVAGVACGGAGSGPQLSVAGSEAVCAFFACGGVSGGWNGQVVSGLGGGFCFRDRVVGGGGDAGARVVCGRSVDDCGSCESGTDDRWSQEATRTNGGGGTSVGVESPLLESDGAVLGRCETLVSSGIGAHSVRNRKKREKKKRRKQAIRMGTPDGSGSKGGPLSSDLKPDCDSAVPLWRRKVPVGEGSTGGRFEKVKSGLSFASCPPDLKEALDRSRAKRFIAENELAASKASRLLSSYDPVEATVRNVARKMQLEQKVSKLAEGSKIGLWAKALSASCSEEVAGTVSTDPAMSKVPSLESLGLGSSVSSDEDAKKELRLRMFESQRRALDKKWETVDYYDPQDLDDSYRMLVDDFSDVIYTPEERVRFQLSGVLMDSYAKYGMTYEGAMEFMTLIDPPPVPGAVPEGIAEEGCDTEKSARGDV